MTAPGKGSRWGAFLSSAFEGVENRLDNLLDEDQQAAQGYEQQQGMKAAPAPSPSPSPSPKPTASAAAPKPNRANDRLQARLAKAMASRTSQSSPRSSIDTSRSSVDKERPASTEPVVTRQSIEVPEIKPTESANQVDKSTSSDSPASAPPAEQPATSEGSDSQEVSEQNLKHDFPTPIIVEPPFEAEPRSTPEEVTEKSSIQQKPNSPISDIRHPVEAPQIVDASVEESQKDQDAPQAHAPRAEEIQEYIEQIDSLQAKLQFLSKNAADAARQTASSAEAGSVERKLAEKDEKIALLMEEGRKLSTSEQKFRTTVRKLRTQIIDNEKQANELKQGKEKALAEVESLRSRINNKEEQEQRNEEVRKANAMLQKELDALKKDKAVKEEAYRRLEQESKAKTEQIQATHTEALKKALDVEKNKQQELDRTIASLRSEKEALVEKLHLTEIEWQEKLDRALERGRNIEEELKLELRAVEGKLEAMRVTAEEASAGSGGDIKLIRHIETLQSQYASASENWQGIETSLLAKAASLEKERDEAQRRESEMRKKARDAATRYKRLEDELQDVSPALTVARQELETCREELAALRIQHKSVETALEQARNELEKQQRAASREVSAEAERRQWADDVATSTPRSQSRPDSPLLSVARTFSSDFIGLPVPARQPRRVPTPGSQTESAGDGFFFGRRMSSQPPRPSALSTAGHAIPPPPPFSPFEPPTESPRAASPPPDRDDGLDDGDPSSPRNVAQDMISVSTVGAGPSVQLVERMSAAIRRLEAEKVAAKEEMARVCSQRDEARSDIVNLMTELETQKTASARVTELEAEVENINSRYQTTLEMLGEKSELVEELKADVQDVKDMYRELVERTVMK
ncbi:TATA element modulatory factor [Fusarium tjaetaba]|uniref:TATA element modulatory factor n=1 Tax=Fusarium tjaetaba TaxID=1567544 RepID=A0A8H5VWJ2_9HYPO|nr:TATA element modulatory factor [Fusarium tjaetaba]KAF5637010.1 TATA element modulatory factor [Fusarium tjaetaba]